MSRLILFKTQLENPALMDEEFLTSFLSSQLPPSLQSLLQEPAKGFPVSDLTSLHPSSVQQTEGAC